MIEKLESILKEHKNKTLSPLETNYKPHTKKQLTIYKENIFQYLNIFANKILKYKTSITVYSDVFLILHLSSNQYRASHMILRKKPKKQESSQTELLLSEKDTKTPTLSKNERGATMVEYALIVSLMGIACIGVIGFMKEGVDNKFNEIGRTMGVGAMPSESEEF